MRYLTAVSLTVVLFLTSCTNTATQETEPTTTPPESAAVAEETTTAPEPTTTSKTTPTTAEEAVNDRLVIDTDVEWDTVPEAVIGRYELYHEAFSVATGAPFADPSYEPLLDLMTEPLAEGVTANIQSARDLGVIAEVSDKSEHNIRFVDDGESLVEIEGSEVVLQDCWIDIFEEINVADGLVNRESEKVHLINALLIYQDDEWRVDALNDDTEDSDGWDECQEYGEGVLNES